MRAVFAALPNDVVENDSVVAEYVALHLSTERGDRLSAQEEGPPVESLIEDAGFATMQGLA